MARIVAGVGLSHSPSILSALDWEEPFYRKLLELRKWIATLSVDALVILSSEHLNALRFDYTATFLLGVSERYEAAAENDQTERQRQFRPGHAIGNVDLAWGVAEHLVAAGMDLTIAQSMKLDHGVLNVLPFLCDSGALPIVPLLVNAFQPPLPTPARCWKLGQELNRAISALPQDWRVAIVGAGGLSHHLLGPDVGFTNEEWDHRYMDLLERNPEVLAGMSTLQMVERGGQASTENVNWLAMRASLGSGARVVHKGYHRPSFTGLGMIGFEN